MDFDWTWTSFYWLQHYPFQPACIFFALSENMFATEDSLRDHLSLKDAIQGAGVQMAADPAGVWRSKIEPKMEIWELNGIEVSYSYIFQSWIWKNWVVVEENLVVDLFNRTNRKTLEVHSHKIFYLLQHGSAIIGLRFKEVPAGRSIGNWWTSQHISVLIVLRI